MPTRPFPAKATDPKTSPTKHESRELRSRVRPATVKPRPHSARSRASAPELLNEDRIRTQKGGDTPRLRIRMYRHGLGDCILLRFAHGDGKETFNLLIDCGLIMVAGQPKLTMHDVVRDIEAACMTPSGKAKLDVVVMTHEHWDHVSGFSQQQAQGLFSGIDIGEVWYGWTEDPQDDLGRRLRSEREAKVKALAAAAQAMAGNPMLNARAERLGAMLGFFGLNAAATGEGIGKTRAAFDYLRLRSNVKTRYCAPEKPPLVLPSVPNVRVYVLGPPKDEGLIKKSTPSKKGREVYEFAADTLLARNLDAAFLRMVGGEDHTLDDCPFDPTLRRCDGSPTARTPKALQDLIWSTWDASGTEWRRIDNDWMQAAETLALNLDSHTNNTCLVLAFEFTDTGQVMLFPADAQVGNWLSWHNLRWPIKTATGTTEVTASDLLARTVFYKVGHHGSHNATLRAMGLEQMTSEDLVAFIPVVREQAVKNRWMGMPFGPLVKRLDEKTHGRLLISDQAKPDGASLHGLHEEASTRFTLDVVEDPLWFEYRFG